jgi:RimJ/RimL family protein N-acetyltransferase
LTSAASPCVVARSPPCVDHVGAFQAHAIDLVRRSGPPGYDPSSGAAVILRETGEFVGDVGLHWVSVLHRQGELGFVIHLAHQGRGYAVEASVPLLDFAFQTLELHRVIGRAESGNAPSVRVLEKIGMRHEAHLVENEWVKGEWQSEVVYAILATEWASRGDR